MHLNLGKWRVRHCAETGNLRWERVSSVPDRCGDCRYGAKWNIRAAKSDTGTTGSEECADAGISDAQHASALGAFAYLGLDGGYYWRCGADGIRPFPSESGREKGSVLF